MSFFAPQKRHAPFRRVSLEASRRSRIQSLRQHIYSNRRLLLAILPSLGIYSGSIAIADPTPKYDSFAENYDGLDDGPLASSLGMEKQRKEILDNAAGKTLEVGIGTGINLKYYNFSNLESLTGVDLSRKMLEQAQKKRIANLGKNINFEVANVEDLPFPDSYFDTVVDTFSMCVYPDPRKAISEMKRVLKDDGKLLLLEHTRSKMPLLAAYQDVSANSVAHLGKGCFWNQNIDEIIQSAHLDVVDRKEHLSGLITSYQITKRWSQDS